MSGHSCPLPESDGSAAGLTQAMLASSPESLPVISSSQQGDDRLTQNELSTCGTIPNPQAFPYGPLAADSPLLTDPSLFASLGYGSAGRQNC